MNKKLKYGCGCLSIFIVGAIFLMFALFFICFTAEDDYCEIDQSEIFNSAEKIEKLTGIQLPEFDVIEYKSGPRDFFGDGSDTLVVNFRSVNTDSIALILNQFDYLQKTESKRYEYFSKEKDYGVFIVLKGGNEGKIVYSTW